MQKEHQIVKEVYLAKNDSQKADDLIRAYIPFIRSEASKFLSHQCTEQDDENSIAMMAFYEAIMGYERHRGGFLNYATMLIKSRLLDYSRKEACHRGNLSLNQEMGTEDERTLADSLVDNNDVIEEAVTRQATREEILELSNIMKDFDVTFSDIADNCPKQERTLEKCAAAIRYGAKDKNLLSELLKTKKLPMNELVSGSGIVRKTLERHRKYILAMLLIQTNGYEIIRGHLQSILRKKEGVVK